MATVLNNKNKLITKIIEIKKLKANNFTIWHVVHLYNWSGSIESRLDNCKVRSSKVWMFQRAFTFVLLLWQMLNISNTDVEHLQYRCTSCHDCFQRMFYKFDVVVVLSWNLHCDSGFLLNQFFGTVVSHRWSLIKMWFNSYFFLK